MDKIYDVVRERWVPDFPEERIRQSLLKKMIEQLDYPKNMIAVEKNLHSFNKTSFNAKQRRLDIVCFAKDDKGALKPIFIIECKAFKLSTDAINQVIGYNYFIKARFLAIANSEQIKTFWYDNNKYVFIDFLPKYQDIIKMDKEIGCLSK